MTKFDFGSLDRPFEADWPVKVNVPQDGGTVAEETFTVRFRVLTDDEMTAVEKHKEPSKELIRQAAIGFAQDAGAEFSPALLEQMLSRGFVRLALNRAYGEFAMGSAAKN